MYKAAEDASVGDIQPLGTGGTAEVVKAYHKQLGHPVAIKYARADTATPRVDFGCLLAREYDLISTYRFPGLVRPLVDPAPHFDRLILEFCPGPTLDRVGKLDNLDLTLNIISAIALDLEFLRAAGLIHGDLKPQNVFLPENWKHLRSEQLFWVKLSDFSLGRRIGEPESSRLGLGTVGYMAPETIREHLTVPKSDLFALGVIAYQLLTGRHPFMNEDNDPVKVNGRICEQAPTPLAQLRPELSEELVQLINRLLAKDADGRPDSAWEVCLTLQAIGARYPFRRVLQPGFVIRRDTAFDDIVSHHLRISNSERERLTELTDLDTNTFLLILIANFRRGLLEYDNGRFRFSGDIYWPHRLREATLGRFSPARLSQKKIAVRAAVTGGFADLHRILPETPAAADGLPRALPQLLLPLLRSCAIKRISAQVAPVADQMNAHDIAARLHLQAGNLSEAERCADIAARAFLREDRAPDALALLLQVDRAARMSGREYEIRESLKLKGIIHKDTGELDLADQTFSRVIRLYQDRPPDKLLAETYKLLGDVYRLRQDSKAALAALEKSLAVFTELGDELEISHTLTNMGNVHWLSNDTRKALTQYRAAYRIQKRLDARTDVASTLNNIASVYCVQGKLKRSIFLFNHSLKLKKEIGNQGEIARTLNNLGYTYQLAGSDAKAAEALAEALAINRRIGSKKEILYNLENLVGLKVAAGQLRESQTLLDEGLALAQSTGILAHEGPLYSHQATISKRMGQYDDASHALSAIDSILTRLDDQALRLAADIQRGSIRYYLGDREGALTIARQTYQAAVESRNSPAELDSLLLLLKLTDEPSYWESARKIVEERKLRREHRIAVFSRLEFVLEHDHLQSVSAMADDPLLALDGLESNLELPWMLNVSGTLALRMGNRARAAARFEPARALAERIGLTPELIISLTMLGRIAKTDGEYETAFSHFKRALRLCKQVADTIDDVTDRSLFLGRPMVVSLAAEIKALGSRLGQKERAGR
ncbi:MAG: serine/threonine-protein kinase [Candidatus Zixiibacteriota bacterium]